MSQAQELEKDYSKYAFSDPEQHVFKSGKGLTEELVREISKQKNEPEWMLKMRLRGFKHFQKRAMPKWGADLSGIDFDNIHYYLKPHDKQEDNWDDVPEYIKNTFNKLGIPEAEQKFLGGVGAQYDSDVIYHKIRDDLAKKGVVFLDMEGGIREYPEICKKYFGKVIPAEDNKFAALNTAVWSGGSFVYVPKGVHVDLPLQAYFRINAKNMGQFERTLIVTEPGASVHYVEGCFTKGTQIQTFDGEKNIEEIKVGDVVKTHTGMYQRVYDTMKRKHTGLLCHIKVNHVLRPLHITGGHPILTVKAKEADKEHPNWNPHWVEAKDVQEGDFVAFPINCVYQEFSAGNQVALQKLRSYDHCTQEYAFSSVSSVKHEHVADLQVYNFSVEHDESYISEGIAVHNCTAPVYSSDSLHAAVVELVALEDSKIRYTTIQNWSNNVYNLVTKRAFAHKNATVEWVDGNLGSKITMKYPAIYLLGEGARGDVLSVAFAGKNQVLDAGAKIVHVAPNTTSKIVNKSVSRDGGKTLYRGLLDVHKGAHHVKSSVICDALILDKDSSSDTIPYMNINEKKVSIGHEASVGKVSEEQLFYLMSRGLDEEQAMTMIVSGFIEPFTKELPVEYAVELNKLIALSMEGSVG